MSDTNFNSCFVDARIDGGTLKFVKGDSSTYSLPITDLQNRTAINSVHFNQNTMVFTFAAQDGSVKTIQLPVYPEYNDFDEVELIGSVLTFYSNGSASGSVNLSSLITESVGNPLVDVDVDTTDINNKKLVFTTASGSKQQVNVSNLLNKNVLKNVAFNTSDKKLLFAQDDGDVTTIDLSSLVDLTDVKYDSNNFILKFYNKNSEYLTIDLSAINNSTSLSRETNLRISGDTALSNVIFNESVLRLSGDTYLSNSIEIEKNARILADESLTSAINSINMSGATILSTDLSNEKVIRSLADATISTAISLETTNRLSTDIILSTNISTDIANLSSETSTRINEVSSRISTDNTLSSTISTEIIERISGDTYLTARISTDEYLRMSVDFSVSTKISNDYDIRLSNDTSLSTTLSTEISNRISIDTSTSLKQSTESSTRSSADLTLFYNLSTETSSRTSVDTSLSTKLSTDISLKTSTDTSLSTSIYSETNLRITGDTSLSNSISNETSLRISNDSSLSTKILTEESVRGSVDNSLSVNLSNNISNVSSLSTKISNEESVRGSVDNSLSVKLSNNISNVSSLSTGLSSNISTRISTDNLLSNNISTEISTRTSNVTSISTSVSTLNSTKENISNKGIANGYAPLDASSKVPVANTYGTIPNIITGATLSSFPLTGNTSNIYVANDTLSQYRWSGLSYVNIDAGADKVSKTGDESISGVKTFSLSPIIPTPTTNLQAATKQYVDAADAQLGADLNTVSNGLGQLIESVYGVESKGIELITSYSHKYIEIAGIGYDLQTAINNSTNVGGYTSNAIKVHKGMTISIFYNNVAFVNPNTVILYLDDNLIIKKRIVRSNISTLTIDEDYNYVAIVWWNVAPLSALFNSDNTTRKGLYFNGDRLLRDVDVNASLNRFDKLSTKVANIIGDFYADGKWINTDSIGKNFYTAVVETTGTWGCIFKPIKAHFGDTIYRYNNKELLVSSNTTFLILDSNYTIIRAVTTGITTSSYTIVDENASYVALQTGREYKSTSSLQLFSVFPNNGAYFDESRLAFASELPNSIKSVVYVSVGDSITQGDGVSVETGPDDFAPESGTWKKTYAYYIAKQNNWKWHNCGVSGSAFAMVTAGGSDYGGVNSFAKENGRYTTLPSVIDYLSIFFGWNDNAFGARMKREEWLTNTYGISIYYPTTTLQIGTTHSDGTPYATQAQYDACMAATGSVGGVTYTNNSDYFRALYVGTKTDTTNKTLYGAYNIVIPYLKVKYPYIKILIIIPYLSDDYNNVFRNGLKSIAEYWGLSTYDMMDKQHWFYDADYILKSEANGMRISRYQNSLMLVDGVHPNAAGYQYFYKGISTTLNSI